MQTTLDNNDPEVRKILDAPDLDTNQRYQALQELKEQRRYAADDGVITPAQQEFIKYMVMGASQADAYREAYPKASESSVYSSASRLMDRPSIQQRIEDGKMEIQLRKRQRAKNKLLAKLEAVKDRRQVLFDIIHHHQISRLTVINQETGATTLKLKEDPMLSIQAIKLDMKLEEQQDLLEEELLRMGVDPDAEEEHDLDIGMAIPQPNMEKEEENDNTKKSTNQRNPRLKSGQAKIRKISDSETNKSKKKNTKNPCETLLKKKT